MTVMTGALPVGRDPTEGNGEWGMPMPAYSRGCLLRPPPPRVGALDFTIKHLHLLAVGPPRSRRCGEGIAVKGVAPRCFAFSFFCQRVSKRLTSTQPPVFQQVDWSHKFHKRTVRWPQICRRRRRPVNNPRTGAWVMGGRGKGPSRIPAQELREGGGAATSTFTVPSLGVQTSLNLSRCVPGDKVPPPVGLPIPWGLDITATGFGITASSAATLPALKMHALAGEEEEHAGGDGAAVEGGRPIGAQPPVYQCTPPVSLERELKLLRSGGDGCARELRGQSGDRCSATVAAETHYQGAAGAEGDVLGRPDSPALLEDVLLAFVLRQLRLRRGGGEGVDDKNNQGPLIVGLSAVQGAGKTFQAARLKASLEKLLGIRVATLSLDDFYLTFAEQQRVAAHHRGNPLLQFRGNAGTHDVGLCVQTLSRLLQQDAASSSIAGGGRNESVSSPACGSGDQEDTPSSCSLLPVAGRGDEGAGGVLRLPCYDKTLQGGRGDRLPPHLWPEVRMPVGVVVLDGWMLGFSPFDSSTEDSGVQDEDVDTGGAIAASTAPPKMGPGSDPEWLHDVNDYLKAYSDIDAKIHSWVVLEPPSLQLVYRWRLQQEQQPREGEGEVEISTREEGGGNRRRLTEAEVEDFVNR
eukprot:GHVU01011789.1.p1 GENE.GHVU01011789.1~~GHVU01011789.1.p1  ORF type:complete len:635 (-),score=92.04 GHVU01011789.1:287-2191(-)